MEKIIEFLKNKMDIEEVTTGLNFTRAVGTIHSPIGTTINEIKEYCASTDYTPLFTEDKGKHIVHFGVFRKVEDKPKYWLNILLFLATILSTIFAGSLNSGGNPFQNFGDIFLGIPFSFSIMAILTCHELGHYFMSRRAGMVTTLPYFIPMPLHFLGTFGAVIRMKSIVPSRKILLRVGMAGPLAGFLVALPITIIGITLSEIHIAPEGTGYLKLGDSLLFLLLAKIIYPNIPQGADLFLHPMAFAGWLGFLVTSLNLVPIGQLDGGHIAYSVLLRKCKYLKYPIIIALIALGFLWLGWIFWALIAFFLARREPVIQDSLTPLTKKEKLYALLPLIVLVLTFTPQPFTF